MICRYLTYEDRKRLEALYGAGEGLPEIAEELGVHLSTIYRELARGSMPGLDRNGRSCYAADLAQEVFAASLKRKGKRKGNGNPLRRQK